MTRIAVVGIGADGWPGLGEPARAAILGARTIFGSERQLALLPAEAAGERRALPSPLEPLLDELADRPRRRVRPRQRRPDAPRHRRLARPPARARSASTSIRIPPPSRWPARGSAGPPPTSSSSAPSRARRTSSPACSSPAAGSSPTSPARTGRARSRASSRERGFGGSRLVVLEQLGAPAERVTEATAESFDAPADPLHAVAIEVGDGPLRALVPGLPDDAYETDGQLTKRHVRAITLAALAPAPGALLWDVGAGSGSIAHRMAAGRARPPARSPSSPTPRAPTGSSATPSPSASPTG